VCFTGDGVTLGSLHDDKLVVPLSVPSPESLVVHEERLGTSVQIV
jgi:hypothetical protein